jgi:glycerophosphoryl diester phosphodiesterase
VRAFLRPIAHRGLHDAGRGVIENTGPAFAAAIAGGCGIECDLQPAAGGLPAVFHDATLDRLIEGSGPLRAAGADDLARVRHKVSGEPILTFEALLALVAGRVPLLVEVKSDWATPDRAFLSAIAALAAAYRGPIAVMSFDPAVVSELGRLAPGVARGLVSGSYRSPDGQHWWADRLDGATAAGLARLDGLERCGAGFAAYEVEALPTPQTEALRRGARPVFAWTVRNRAQQAHAMRHADAIIFEGFDPDP